MDYYTNTRPNLISTRVRKRIKILANKKPAIKGGDVNSGISDFLQNIYNTYIKPNTALIVFIISFSLFALYRVKQRQLEREIQGIENEKILEQFVDDEPGDLSHIIDNQINHVKYKDQPTLNPLFPVNSQYTEKVNYPPEHLPINLGQEIVMAKDMYPTQRFPNMIDPNVNYDIPYTHSTRNYYTGMNNPYKNAQDTTIENPLGYSNNFNTSTGAFVGQNVNLNQEALQTYNSYIQDTQKDLTNTLDYGPAYLQETPSNKMVPPYSTNLNIDF